MRADIPQPLTLAIAILIGVVTVGGASWALGAAAAPKAYKARLAAIERSVAEIERASPQARSIAISDKTLCKGAVLKASGAVRDTLVRNAGAAGMVVGSLTVSPGSTSGRLSAIDVAFTAEGPYEGAVRLIGALGTAQPEVFVDGVELRPAAGGTRLKVTGRAFCWSSARL
jgi:hypothetical protein